MTHTPRCEDDRLEENNTSLLSNCAKLWNYFCNLLFLAFAFVHGKLSSVGQEIDIGTGVASIAVFGFLIYGSLQINTRGIHTWNKLSFLNFHNLRYLLGLCFIRHELDIQAALVVILILGYDIPKIVMSRLVATSSPWLDFLLLMYILAYFLVLCSLILKCIQRMASQIKLMAGIGYTCAILGILSISVSLLSSEFVCVFILGILVLPAALYMYDGAH